MANSEKIDIEIQTDEQGVDENMTKKQTNSDKSDIKQDKSENPFESQSDNVSTEENTIETLKQQLEVLKQKADKNFDLALRAKAELDNVRKRAEQDVANAHKFALERFIPELLPLLDGLDQGLNTMTDDSSVQHVKEGLTLSIKMFNDVLVKFGVTVEDPVGKAFDPAKHEAISMQPSDDAESGTVLIVVQKGYILNNRVLRPARVVVAQ